MNRGKIPKSRITPTSEKVPRRLGFDENANKLHPAWRLSAMEWCDPYGWHEVGADKLHHIRTKLMNFESMTWQEILNRNNHLVQLERLDRTAQQRLRELKLDDLDALVSLRLSGVERVWGYLEHNIYTLLWWDPNHQVCPALLKHT